MGNLKVGNQELERGYKPYYFGPEFLTNLTKVISDGGPPVTGLMHAADDAAVADTPYISSRGALKVATILSGDRLYWTIPLSDFDLSSPISLAIAFTSNTPAAAGKTFTTATRYAVYTPGASGGSTAALTTPIASAGVPDQEFGTQTLAAQNTWQWTGTVNSATSANMAIINAPNLITYQNSMAFLQVTLAITFGAGLTDLAISHLIVNAVPLIGVSPSEVITDTTPLA